MDWLCPVLGLLTLLLVLVAVVGHGLWMLFGAVFRGLFGKKTSPPDVLPLSNGADTLCAHCGRMSSGIYCVFCGRPRSQTGGSLLEELSVTARQAGRLYRDGRIGTATHAQLMEAIQHERARAVAEDIASPAGMPAGPPLAPEEHPALAMALRTDDEPVGHDVHSPASTFENGVTTKEERPATVPLKPESGTPPLQPPVPARPPVTLPPSPVESGPPRRAFSEMLAAFMEEKNIRWGELIGGMLIVCCSIALVVRFWAQIADRPYLEYFLFTAVTAALFGAGLYTEHRWKLPTTSRGILIIASLLVPLNFLAIAAFSEGASRSAGAVVGEVVAVVLFAFLTWVAGKVITPRWPIALALGVVGASATQLFIHRISGPAAATPTLVGLGAVPLACYLAATGRMLWTLLGKDGKESPDSPPTDAEASNEASPAPWTRAPVGRELANIIFTFLGLAGFAVLVPLGLLVFKSGNIANALRQLSMLIALLGAPALATGVLLWQRITDKELSLLRAVGTTVAVVGTVVMIGALVPAWPQASSLVPIALLNAVLFAALALALNIPEAHWPAGLCVLIAYLVTYHVAAGHVNWHNDRPEPAIHALTGPAGGAALVPLVAALIAGYAGLTRWGLRRHGFVYATVAGATAALSLLLATWHGLGRPDDHGATWIYAIYALAAFVGAAVTGRTAATWTGSTLLLVALVQGFVFRFRHLAWDSQNPLLLGQLALLSHASIVLAAGGLMRLWPRTASGAAEGGQEDRPPAKRIDVVLAGPLLRSALWTSILAAAIPLPVLQIRKAGPLATGAFWLAGVWAALAFARKSSRLFTAAQAALTWACSLAVIANVSRRIWFEAAAIPLLHPRTLQAIGITLAGLGLIWVALRLALSVISKKPRAYPPSRNGETETPQTQAESGLIAHFLKPAGDFLNPPWPSVDRLMAYAVLAGLVLITLTGLSPGIDAEFAPATAQTAAPDAQPSAQAMTALDRGSWALLFAVGALFLARLWEGFRKRLVLALLVTSAVVCLLIAGRWANFAASGSALRWCLAVFWILVSSLLWARRSVYRTALPLQWPDMAENIPRLSMLVRAVLGVLTVIPILAFTVARAMSGISGEGVVGPAAQTCFGRMGETLSYAVPLVLVSAGLIGHGLRERSAGYVFAGGLVINLTITLGRLLWAVNSGSSLAGQVWTDLLQFNALAAGGFALAWMGGRFLLWRRKRPEMIGSPPILLYGQVGIAVLLNVLLIAPAAQELVFFPHEPGARVAVAGSVWGWVALMLTIAAAAALGRVRASAMPPAMLCVIGLSVACLIAFNVVRWDTGQWQSYHALLVATTVVAWLIFGLGSARPTWISGLDGNWPTGDPDARPSEVENAVPAGRSRQWVGSIGVAAGVAFLLALRGVFSDPGRPWWSVGTLVELSVLAAVLAPRTQQEPFVHVSGVLFGLAATTWWVTRRWAAAASLPVAIIELAEVNAVALLLPATASLSMRLRGWLRPTASRFAFHEVAAVMATVIVACAVGVGLAADVQLKPLPVSWIIGWLALGAAVAVTAGCLLDWAAPPTWPLLYLLGLIAIGLALDPLDLQGPWLAWNATAALGLYTLAIGGLYRYLPRRWLTGLGIQLAGHNPPLPRVGAGLEAPRPASVWLVPTKKALSALIVALAGWVVLRFSPALTAGETATAIVLRIAAGLSVAVCATGIAILGDAMDRFDLRRAGLLLFAASVVLTGWALVEPDIGSAHVLDRAVILMAAVTLTALGYALIAPRQFGRTSPWTTAATHSLAPLAAVAVISLIFILGSELRYAAKDESIPMTGTAGLGVILLLLGVAAAAIWLAVVPEKDPLNLSERGRTGYVYGAEALIAMVVIHVRLTMPWLFRGFFEQFWPVIVMVISFLGVGLAEVFRRQNRRVLWEPFENTGLFLPLLPAIGFWMGKFDSRVDYSIQLLLIGLLYAISAVRRGSFGLGLLAGAAGNGALWYALFRTENFGILDHPQIWFIPPALSLLVAAHLNRDRLSSEQGTALRYTAVVSIYVSSTADIFINGVLQAPWLPLVLAGLSVAGVLAGILMRIRSFLFLGSGFLLLALVTMIRHATLNFGWTWLWYVAGIILGVLIIALFALFEKKRHQMLQLIDQLKGWQP